MMRKKSKIDLWVSLLLWATAVIIFTTLILIPAEEKVIGYFIGIPALIIILWMYFGSYFELKEDYLYCRIGPFYEKIQYEKIKSLKLSRNFLSSMALSRERIEIHQHGKGYFAGTTFISPVDREEFYKALADRCKSLESKDRDIH